MIYTEFFEKRHRSFIDVLSLGGNLCGDPMVYTDMAGKLLGCNERLLGLFEEAGCEAIPPIERWFEPTGSDLSLIVSKPGNYRGKIHAAGKEYTVELVSEAVVIDGEPLVGMVFRDMTMLERAKTAERYFEAFKQKLLSNISHEFRTPMNAVIGFSDLLKSTPLTSWQKEYLHLSTQSALSMMRNIENLMELVQVESGNVHPAPEPFDPAEAYENLAHTFGDAALGKEIELLFLIDPRLPGTIIGDREKILAVMGNLIQNGIKFTDEGGQVLVEILIVRDEEGKVEIEYAVSDTGAGIEKEKIRPFLRPFASAWENQRRGKNGLGVGLGLSYRYVDMMDSHLMFVSEEGKGSRFSFRIVHPVAKRERALNVAGSCAAIYTPEERLAPRGALVHKYLEFFGIRAVGISDLVNGVLHECDLLLLDLPHVSVSQVDAIRSAYPNLRIIPLMDKEYGSAADALADSVDAILSLPLLPGSFRRAFGSAWKTADEERVPEPRPAAPFERGRKRILVAEDNPINLKLIETILLHEGYDLTAVDNGQKAVDAYLEEPFDLVLLDIDMPIMDGLEAQRLIRSIDQRNGLGRVPIIALTAHALIGDRERILSAGLDAHLPKPIDKHFLLQTIERYLEMTDVKGRNTAV